MDLYRSIALCLNVKNFVNLTCCNKKLRELYFEKGTIWKYFLEKDFNYKYHPSYDVERYKKCFDRKNSIICHHEYTGRDNIMYIDWGDFLENQYKSLGNWGLIYKERPIASGALLMLLLYFNKLFHNTEDINPDFAFKGFQNILFHHKSPNQEEESTIKLCNDRCYNLLSELYSIVSMLEITIENIRDNKTTHIKYEESKRLWLELGFQ